MPKGLRTDRLHADENDEEPSLRTKTNAKNEEEEPVSISFMPMPTRRMNRLHADDVACR